MRMITMEECSTLLLDHISNERRHIELPWLLKVGIPARHEQYLVLSSVPRRPSQQDPLHDYIHSLLKNKCGAVVANVYFIVSLSLCSHFNGKSL